MGHITNIDPISSALITLSLSMLILKSQYEEGAKDGIDIWYMGIIIPLTQKLYSRIFTD